MLECGENDESAVVSMQQKEESFMTYLNSKTRLELRAGKGISARSDKESGEGNARELHGVCCLSFQRANVATK